jgi:hypothetical protein
MAARVDGVEIILDPWERLRGFPEDQGARLSFRPEPDLLSGLEQQALCRALRGQRGQAGLFRSPSSTQVSSFHAAPGH